MSFRTFVFLLALPIVAQAGPPPQGVDVSNYDVPLYTQIVDRIKDRVSARLGEGNSTRDREYTEKAKIKHFLLEPVDVKKDRYGFVYAPTRNGDVPYNPLRTASAYQR